MQHKKIKRHSSIYKGVHFNRRLKKYIARVYWKDASGRIRVTIAGIAHDEQLAAILYDKIAKEKYGDKAVLNFPGGQNGRTSISKQWHQTSSKIMGLNPKSSESLR